MSEKRCDLDVVGHPVDVWRIKAKGDKATCDEKLAELLKNAGPYMEKLVTRRWEYEESK